MSHTIFDSTQPLKPLSKKNLEELDRQTGSEPDNRVDRAATGSWREGKRNIVSLRANTADIDQDTTLISTQKSSTLADYRWKNLDYARIFVENVPLPQNISSWVNQIIQPKITVARKKELSLISEALCADFIDVMLGDLGEDDSVEPIHVALRSMDKGKNLVMPRKADWDPNLKLNVHQKTWHSDTIDKSNGTTEDSPDRRNKLQQGEPAYVSPKT